MRLLFLASEMAPYAKTGGLADVVAALPRSLLRAGHDARVFLPLYDPKPEMVAEVDPILPPFEVRLGAHRYEVKIGQTKRDPLVYFVHCPSLYLRGSLYTKAEDEHLRFLTLVWATLLACQRMHWAPEVIHCNDWQTALLPMTLKTRFGWDDLFARTKTLLTIHNLNYQGRFPASIMGDTNLADSAHLFHQDQLREGMINFLLHGILYADGISTVSPTYARQIQSPDHGVGLDPFLRARSSTVVGLLNGVDYDEWSPDKDPHIAQRYGRGDFAGKERNKRALLDKVGLPHVDGVPVFGIVSRLAGQKGFDLVGQVMPEILRRGDFQLVVLGNGGSKLEEMFSALQRAFPKQVWFYKGFNNALAHQIEAGADMFLMPSRYEPCGLNQMYSLRYGTVPVVHRTGGLADTVRQWNPKTGEGTGFSFDRFDTAGLRWAIETSVATYRDRNAWHRLMDNGMVEDFSWDAQRKLYEQVYARLTG